MPDWLIGLGSIAAVIILGLTFEAAERRMLRSIRQIVREELARANRAH